MSDKLQRELEQMQTKRSEMRKDLTTHDDLSAGTKKAIRIELDSLSADIINLRKEIDDMQFQEFMHGAWNGKTDGI